jgi:hypothetical protein
VGVATRLSRARRPLPTTIERVILGMGGGQILEDLSPTVRVGRIRGLGERPIASLCREFVRVSDGTRTRDRRDHNPELYQLSYAHQATAPI